jgi:Spy/CpxP family protein refolding chaperone
MKKIMITAGLLIGLIGASYSQDAPLRKGDKAVQAHREMKSAEERAKMSANALEKKLNLTPEQKEKVYALQLERINKMEKLQKAAIAYRKNQMEKRKELMADGKEKMNNILTEEQEKTLEEMKTKGKERLQNIRRRMHRHEKFN